MGERVNKKKGGLPPIFNRPVQGVKVCKKNMKKYNIICEPVAEYKLAKSKVNNSEVGHIVLSEGGYYSLRDNDLI